MRKTYEKIFRDKKKLREMLKLFKAKNSVASIARYFHCDRSSISHQLTKNQIPKIKPTKKLETETEYQMEYPKNMKDKTLEDFYENGEKILSGLPSYQDYINAEKLRLERANKQKNKGKISATI